MATDSKISALPANPGVTPNDLVEVVDISNTTNNPSGENTKAQVAALVTGLPPMGASGGAHAAGLVPDPGVTSHATPYVLGDDGTFHPMLGSGLSYSGGGYTFSGGTGGGSPFVGAGPGHAAGQVPDPGATVHATPYVLGDDGTFHQLGGTALSYAGGIYTFTAGTGGGATPGGTNGQIQYNNAGGFGGVTSVPVANGGTGLVALPTANQILGVNAGATAYEGKTLTAGANVTITPTAGALTIAATGGGSANNVTLFAAKNLTAVSNSTSLLSLLTGGTVFTGTQVAGGITFPTSLLVSGARITFDLHGIYSSATANVTLKWSFTVNGTMIMQSAANPLPTISTNATWLNYNKIPTIYFPAVSGAASFAEGLGVLETAGPSTLAHWLDAGGTGASTSASTAQAVDLSNATTTLDLKIQWGLAATGDTLSIKDIVVSLLLPS